MYGELPADWYKMEHTKLEVERESQDGKKKLVLFELCCYWPQLKNTQFVDVFDLNYTELSTKNKASCG